MIKLIATDLDGTLLDSKKRLPENFFSAVSQLYERGVRVAIASGRQYYNLLKMFEEIQDKLFFICENGAIVFDGRENIFYDEISHSRLSIPLQAIKRVSTSSVVLCGVNSAYIDGINIECERHARMYYERCVIVDDLLKAAENDRICKIALFDSEDSEKNLWPLRHEFGGNFIASLSAKNWLDLMNSGTNKGVAINLLQRRMGISAIESMAFGDYLNDLEMMKECHFSYAMSNSHSELSRICNYTTTSNDEDGVMKVLKEKFDLKF